MTLLTNMKLFFVRRVYWKNTKRNIFLKAEAFFDNQGKISEQTKKAVDELAKCASLLATYLMEATRESEASRKVIEAKAKQEEDTKPSKYDEKY